jgi:SAM-dependent methyltransferase
MEGYGPASYGDAIADLYDRFYDGVLDTEGALERLAELAGGGRALELGIGTGRVALPLTARGIAVEGVDSSAAMVAKLRDKPGGDAIPVVLSDFRAPEVRGRFDVVYIVSTPSSRLRPKPISWRASRPSPPCWSRADAL